MSKLKLGELFAGFGGLGMAVEEVFDAELTVDDIKKMLEIVTGETWNVQ